MKIKLLLKFIRLKIIFLPIFIILHYFSFAQSEDDQDLALHYFMQGEFLLKQGNYASAVLELQEAIDLDPNVSTIHVSIADAYRRLGKNRRAEIHLDIAVDLNPKEVEAHELLGQLFISQKRFLEAENTYNELNRIEPDNIDYIFGLADICRIQKKWDNAINYYIEAYKINPDLLSALENAIQIAIATNDYSKSEEICELLIIENPTSTKYLEMLKDLALYNNKYDKALDIIEKLEQLEEPNQKFFLQKSAIYHQLNKPNLAIDQMLNAYKMDSLNADILNELVNLFLNMGEKVKASNYNNILIKNFPLEPRGFINSALIFLENENPRSAITSLAPVISKFENNYTANYLLGISYYQLEDYLNAESYLIKALTIFPNSRSVKHNLALIYDVTRKWTQSDEIYIDLISTDSTDAQAFNNYAYSLVERDQDYDLALELAKISISLKPNSAPYLDTIGWIYFKLKDYENAIKYIKKSLAIDSKSNVIKEHFDAVIKARSEKVFKKNIQQAVIQDSSKILSP